MKRYALGTTDEFDGDGEQFYTVADLIDNDDRDTMRALVVLGDRDAIAAFPVPETRGRQWAAQLRENTGCPDSHIYSTIGLFNSRRDAEIWLTAYCNLHGYWLPSQRIREY